MQDMHISLRPRFTHDDIYQLDSSGPEVLVNLGILKSGGLLATVQCTRCGDSCLIDVQPVEGPDGDIVCALGRCPNPGEESGIVWVDPSRLRTWFADASVLAQVVCRWLGLDTLPATIAQGCAWRLGVFDTGRSSHRVFLAVGLGSDSFPASAVGALDASLKDALAPILLVPCGGDFQLPLQLPREAEVISLTSLLKRAEEGFGLCLDTLTRRLSAGRGDDDNVLPVPPGYQFFSAYRQVRRLGVDYYLLPRHAEIIKKLHKAWADGKPPVHHTDLLRGLPQHTRMRDAFRSRLSAYKDLLKHDKHGYYELNIPEQS